ncbi:MAG: response regulator [Gammaproteobacteria bacterium]
MEKNLTILVVDDDTEIRDLLAKLIEKYGFKVYVAADAGQMWHFLDDLTVDMVILDVMLPGEDGLSLCRKLRQKSSVPIIMLTAAGDETDTVVGLELGADDYIGKPFNPRELVARIKAVLRRTSDAIPLQIDAADASGKILEFNKWVLDTATRQLFSPDKVEIFISSGEYELLTAFLERPQQILSREQLLELTQHRNAGPFDRSIDVSVSRLRQKIELSPKKPTLIKTVRGGGYMFSARVKTHA